MNSNSDKKPALGRGLSAILQNAETDVTSARTAPAGSVSEILISSIETNPFNPRTHFEKEALFDLRESILAHGIIQPLTVRKMGHDKYQLISGERRFRASQLAGLKKVPAYIRIANDQNMLEYALVENIQREDLNAIEIALSYERLLSECELTQEALSEKISKSRSNIANYIRLLKLPSEIQAGLRDRQISMGHARALLAINSEEEQALQFRAIIAEKLSVRAIEEKVKTEKIKSTKSTNSTKVHPSIETKKSLSNYYNTPVKIYQSENGSGKIHVNFSSEEEFQRLVKLLLNK
jgi:ParB family chromosome partitioning protein